MRIIPSRDQIGQVLDATSTGTVAYTTLVADLETPVSAMIKLGADLPYSCLLESVEGGNVRGRFSVIAIDPDLIWSCDQKQAWRATPEGERLGEVHDDPFQSLRQLIDDSRVDVPKELPAMAAGVFGYFGYEMVHHIDDIASLIRLLLTWIHRA